MKKIYFLIIILFSNFVFVQNLAYAVSMTNNTSTVSSKNGTTFQRIEEYSTREPDFGPYMRELQRRFKSHWAPAEIKRVVVLIKIQKDGTLSSARIFKSSGDKVCDEKAMNAVYAEAPFKPLPSNFKGESIDIQFTFDNMIFGGSTQ